MANVLALRRRGVLIPLLLLLTVLLGLSACGQGASGAQGTIKGDVVAGPMCPVERADSPCPPQPVTDRQVTIQTTSGATAVTTTTDGNGRFSVNVAPGSYVVHVLAGPGMLGLRQETPGDVTVTANQTSTIHIELDTGIR
jgi:hypothetical protein